MEFLIGFTGAILAMVIFVSGVVVGWKLKKLHDQATVRVTAEELTEVQKQQVREEREAWNSLHSYSMEDAYGIKIKRPEDE